MKTLNDILNKHGIRGLSVQSCPKKEKGQNNISRDEFKAFCKSNNFEQIGNSNSFVLNGYTFGFSLSNSNKAECRQFSENYDGLVCKFSDGTVKWLDKEQLRIGSCTRIGPDGTKYYNAEEI